MRQALSRFLALMIMVTALPLSADSQPLPAPAVSAKDTRYRAMRLPEGVSRKEVHFYSEGIKCYGFLLTPKDFSAASKAPAVVLAPGWGETADSSIMWQFAAHFASRGLVAMVLDYRGWG